MRKDNLDTYYEKLLSFRNDLDKEASNRKSLAAQTRATESEVMELVIDERIDADGALLLFLSLSNQVLEEARKG